MCFSACFELYTLCCPPQYISGNLFLYIYPPFGGECIRKVKTELLWSKGYRFIGVEMIGKPDLLVAACPNLTLFSAATGKKLHRLSVSPTSMSLSQNGVLSTIQCQKIKQYRLMQNKIQKIGSFTPSPWPNQRTVEHVCSLPNGRIFLLLGNMPHHPAFIYSDKGEKLFEVRYFYSSASSILTKSHFCSFRGLREYLLLFGSRPTRVIGSIPLIQFFGHLK